MSRHNDFCGNSSLTVDLAGFPNEERSMVGIFAEHGPLRLNHTMTPAQARELAAALLADADEIDRIQASLKGA